MSKDIAFRRTQSVLIALKETTLILIFVLFSLSGVSQSQRTIDLKEIPQRKIRKFIKANSIDTIRDFSSIHASWKKNLNESDFNLDEEVFYLNSILSDVWKCYSHADPTKAFCGHSVRFGLLISKYSNSVIYSSNAHLPDVDTGQVYFLNLRLIKGLFNVPVSFEVITIDSLRQVLEFSYIDDNKSLGKQTIQFFDDGDGMIRIVHRSYFKSKSRLRDKLLYPYFHRKLIKEYHSNMRQLLIS